MSNIQIIINNTQPSQVAGYFPTQCFVELLEPAKPRSLVTIGEMHAMQERDIERITASIDAMQVGNGELLGKLCSEWGK